MDPNPNAVDQGTGSKVSISTSMDPSGVARDPGLGIKIRGPISMHMGTDPRSFNMVLIDPGRY